jgi:hypothetical protein
MAGTRQQKNGHNADDPTRARGHWLMPEDLVQFLELLRNNGNVSMSARLVGRSRSTIYAFAGKAPSFREAMREAMTEGRELLLGEGWRRATQWTELKDDEGKVIDRKPPSDRLLAQLIGGYFQEFKPGRGDDLPPDELLPETADLTQLSDEELSDLERILTKVGADERVGAREG